MTIPHLLRRRIADLGALSRPLNDDRAAELAKDILGQLAQKICNGHPADDMLQICRTRICEAIVQSEIMSPQLTSRSCLLQKTPVCGLQQFQAADRYDRL
jgi:hypothetical protein